MIDDVDLSSSTLRLLASQALKSWDNQSVLKLLSDDDYIIRTLAARELQMRGDQDIYDYVISFEKADASHKREICAFILGQLGTPKMPFKASSIPILGRLISDSNPDVRAASAAALGHICFDGMPSEIENALYNAASDESSDVRCCVAASLGSASDKAETQAALAKLLKDANHQVREYAELGLDILKTAKNN